MSLDAGQTKGRMRCPRSGPNFSSRNFLTRSRSAGFAAKRTTRERDLLCTVGFRLFLTPAVLCERVEISRGDSHETTDSDRSKFPGGNQATYGIGTDVKHGSHIRNAEIVPIGSGTTIPSSASAPKPAFHNALRSL